MDLRSVPAGIRDILRHYQAAGHRAYLVGGCVRDALIGRVPGDWDICTSALPEETLALFDRTVPTGIRHGTVTVFYGEVQAEVTTFREDGDYSDHRRPDGVRFTGDLEKDLSRRDFTVNAMAMGLDGVLVDPFGGQEDLKNHVIRCVGNAAQRFREDALRMFRALRFAAQLNWSIDADTGEAIAQNAQLARFVAPERIRVEVEKTLLSPCPGWVWQMVTTGLLDAFIAHREVPQRDLSHLPQDPHLRWASFCFSLHDAGAIHDVSAFLRALRADSLTLRLCQAAVDIAASPFPTDDAALRRLLSKHGPEAVYCAAACGDFPENAPRIDKILASGACLDLAHLAVSGGDLRALGYDGPALGRALRCLLDMVLEDPACNQKNYLLNRLQEEPHG